MARGDIIYMPSFKYELGQLLAIEVSDEVGEVIGRAQYIESIEQYLLRFVGADGRAREEWWSIRAVSDQVRYEEKIKDR